MATMLVDGCKPVLHEQAMIVLLQLGGAATHHVEDGEQQREAQLNEGWEPFQTISFITLLIACSTFLTATAFSGTKMMSS